MKVRVNVIPIQKYEAIPWIMKKHYAKRMPPISYAFGAYEGSQLVGVVTFGMPASPSLCVGVCGVDWREKVLELNRLCCNSKKNLASALVGGALRLLPRPIVVVSYADTGQGHIGYIYQATNFLYTGITDAGRKTPRADRIKQKGKHGRHQGRVNGLADTSIGLVYRNPKHRYVYFCGSKTEKKNMAAALNYKKYPYPKGESKRYDASTEIITQGLLF